MSDIVEPVRRETFTAEEIIDALYRAMLKREPDFPGSDSHFNSLKRGGVFPVVRDFLQSAEFKRIFSEFASRRCIPGLLPV